MVEVWVFIFIFHPVIQVLSDTLNVGAQVWYFGKSIVHACLLHHRWNNWLWLIIHMIRLPTKLDETGWRYFAQFRIWFLLLLRLAIDWVIYAYLGQSWHDHVGYWVVQVCFSFAPSWQLIIVVLLLFLQFDCMPLWWTLLDSFITGQKTAHIGL